MKPLQPLQVSAVLTFAVIAITALATGLWWKERTRLIQDIERLRALRPFE